jgi:uncharacterized protein (UPF0333 family)
MMKAQVSMEYLLLSLVAITLLSISAFSLSKIRDFSDEASDVYAFRSSSISLSNAINEVCALGSGNRREVSLGSVVSLYSREGSGSWLVVFSHSNHSIVKSSPCRVKAVALEGPVYVENKLGTVEIREQ